MAKSSKDIQLVELKDMISQLNTTIKMLNDTISRQQAENDDLKAELAWSNKKCLVLPVNAVLTISPDS